jgi:hypothetical protein
MISRHGMAFCFDNDNSFEQPMLLHALFSLQMNQA